MVPARDSRNGTTEGEAGALEATSRKKKKTTVAVSIRRGKLIFFPTVLREAPDVPAGPPSDRTKAPESEGN